MHFQENSPKLMPLSFKNLDIPFDKLRSGSYISLYSDNVSQSSSSKYYVANGAHATHRLMGSNFEMSSVNQPGEDPKLNYSIEPPQYIIEKKEKQYKEVPDKCNLVYISLVLFGIGSILPFSATTTAIEYFNKNVRIYVINDLMHSYLIISLSSLIHSQ